MGLPYPFHPTRCTSFPGSLILYTTRKPDAANAETKTAPVTGTGAEDGGWIV